MTMPLIRFFPSLSQFGEAAISLAFELHIKSPYQISISNLRTFNVYMSDFGECKKLAK